MYCTQGQMCLRSAVYPLALISCIVRGSDAKIKGFLFFLLRYCRCVLCCVLFFGVISSKGLSSPDQPVVCGTPTVSCVLPSRLPFSEWSVGPVRSAHPAQSDACALARLCSWAKRTMYLLLHFRCQQFLINTPRLHL